MLKDSCGLRSIADDPDWSQRSTPTTSVSRSGNKPGVCTLTEEINALSNEFARPIFKVLGAAYRGLNSFW